VPKKIAHANTRREGELRRRVFEEAFGPLDSVRWIERLHRVRGGPISLDFVNALEAAGARPELVAALRKDRARAKARRMLAGAWS
jgi:hypothetical protein